ncbi:hypothetical protein XA68_10824 [Ophiocordyceps unilateralis]|uniref:Uncharacterized protein n=1 Tax=Ophiocordyceps unilateralis TaxID=268505 RepID=A0A2A9PHZ5_OPHUN|nr:hypothetical protein XA68_10824 [Ophiocordyceps unilateralis]
MDRYVPPTYHLRKQYHHTTASSSIHKAPGAARFPVRIYLQTIIILILHPLLDSLLEARYRPHRNSIRPTDLFPLAAAFLQSSIITSRSQTNTAMPGPAGSYSVSIPISPPPPQSLSTYSRFMHDHTKRQMESFGAVNSPASSHHSSRSSNAGSLANGVGPSGYHP